VKLRELERHLTGHGCQVARQGGNHTLWQNPRSGKVAPVPRHREVKEGTIQAAKTQLRQPVKRVQELAAATRAIAHLRISGLG
jgi:mRNA interferase HicA